LIVRARGSLALFVILLAGAPQHAFATLAKDVVVAREAVPVTAGCLKALAPLDADSVPDSDKFEQADCTGKTEAAFRYDQVGGFTRAVRAISAGQIVPAYPEFSFDMVRPGQTLHLVVVTGATRVQRQVVAMQSARPGQRLFVKSSDGQILSVRFEGGVQ
jgi:hypothetical protein